MTLKDFFIFFRGPLKILKDLKWTIRHSLLPCQTDSPLDIFNSILILNFVQESLNSDWGTWGQAMKNSESRDQGSMHQSLRSSDQGSVAPEKFWNLRTNKNEKYSTKSHRAVRGSLPGILGFLNSASEKWIWITEIVELQKWFKMIPNLNRFPGNRTSKIRLSTFAWAFE